jgi:uncharacterized protein (DUF1778 family)
MAKKPTFDPDKTISVRLSERRYNLLREDAKKNGHSLTWLLAFIVDLYYQEKEKP